MQSFTSVLALIALISPMIDAHTRFTTLYVDGQSQGDGTCVRMDMNAALTTYPIADITSSDMTCGKQGLTPVARTCPVKAGSTVSFQFRQIPDGSAPGVIAYGHSGPCAIYMKQISSSTPGDTFPTNDPTGDGWFKIMYEDYDTSTNHWCTDRLSLSSDGVISAVIPSDVKSGYYLLRPELLALHNANKGDPQFYTGCAQVYIDGGSGTASPQTASIPGYVSYSTPAMQYNLYTQPLVLPYPGYGPPVYKSGGSKLLARESHAVEHIVGPPLAPRIPADFSVRATAEAFGCPANTVLELGNWCGVEVPSYTDTTSAMTNCWAASKQCWDTADSCWSSFPPAVNNDAGNGCSIWNARCEEIGNACTAQIKTGPPNAGKIRTPGKKTLGSYGIEK